MDINPINEHDCCVRAQYNYFPNRFIYPACINAKQPIVRHNERMAVEIDRCAIKPQIGICINSARCVFFKQLAIESLPP